MEGKYFKMINKIISVIYTKCLDPGPKQILSEY